MMNDVNKPLVSIIIPTYNRCEVLCNCIDSIIKSTYEKWECIIVDNASTDSTVEVIEEKYRENNIKVIRLSENLMAAGGRNAGIKVTNGEYILFIDNDNIIENSMIEILVTEAMQNPKLGLVGPISINKYANDTIWMVSGDYNYYTSRPKTLFAGKRIDEVQLEKSYSTKYSPNIFMVSRKALDKVGGLDTFYYAMYEEADFGIRICNAGFECRIITDARTHHMGAVGNGEQAQLRALGIEKTDRAYYFARNRSVFQKKYANWYQKIVFFLIFVHLFNVYYCLIALKNKRVDIAKAWFLGTWKGILSKTSKNLFIEI